MAPASFLYSSGILIDSNDYFVSQTLQKGKKDKITVQSGGTVIGTLLQSKGAQYVYAGGSASATVISSGGALHVYSGAKVRDTTVNQSGYFGIGGGAYASNTYIETAGALTVWGGGVVETNTINTWGAIILSSGAKAIKTTVNANGGLHVYAGAVASETTVNQGGIFGVGFGAKVYDTTIGYAGNLTVWGGGYAENNTIEQYGAIILKSNALAVKTEINSQGGLHVYAGAVASETTVNQGGIFGVGFGAKVYDTTIGYAGNLTVWGGGYAENNTIDTWGAIILSSGAIANSTNILANGGLHIYNGATAFTTNVEAGATLGIGYGGTVYNLAADYGAGLVFYDGSILRGFCNFAGSVTVNGKLDAAGSIIDFVLTDRTSADGAIINDISRIEGAAYTVGSNDFLQAGSYKLAGNAGNFSGNITIRDEYINQQATLFLNTTVQLGLYTYELVRDNTNTLVLNVAAIPQSATYMVYDGQYKMIASGATGNAVTVGGTANGRILLASGAAITNTAILAGGAGIAAKNAQLNTVQITQGTLNARTGAKISNATINQGGYLTLEKGGSAVNVTVNANGGLVIQSGGTAFQVTDGGNMAIHAGGSAVNVTQLAGTYLNVNSKGYLQSGIVQANAATVVHGKALAEDLTISSGGIVRLYESAAINRATIKKDGLLEVDFGASATDVTLGSGAAGMTIAINKNTLVTGTSAGSSFAISQGVLSGFNWSASIFALSSCTELYFSMGAETKAIDNSFSAGHLLVYSGGAAINNDLHYFAQLNVYSGGTASGITLDSEAEMYIMGGKGYGATVNSGGYVWVSSDGLALDTVVNDGGHLDVGSTWYYDYTGSCGGNGGYASRTTVNSGGLFELLSGTSASESTIYGGGYMIVDASKADDIRITGYGAGLFLRYGGSADTITVENGAGVGVYRGGALSKLQLHNGHLTVTGELQDVTLEKDKEKYISSAMIYQSAGQANDVTLYEGAVMNIVSGGGASSVIASGGGLYINEGSLDGLQMEAGNAQTASNGILKNARISGGYLTIVSGGSANNIDAVGGGFFISGGAKMEDLRLGADAILNLAVTRDSILSGEAAARVFRTENQTLCDFTVNSQSELHLKSNGRLSGTLVKSGALLYVSSSGEALDTVVENGGVVTLFSNGVVNGGTYNGNIDIKGGLFRNGTLKQGAYANVSGGGSASAVIVSSGAGLLAYDNSRITDLTVLAGGAAVVYDGGKLEGAILREAFLTLSGGSANAVTVSSGAGVLAYENAKVTTLTVLAGGVAEIQNGASLNGATVQDAYIHIRQGGTADSVTISSGAGIFAYENSNVSNLTIHSGGAAAVYSGALNDLTLSGGNLTLSGGNLSGGVLGSGAILFGSNSARITGLTLQDGGVVSLTKDCTCYGTLSLTQGASFQANGARIDFTLTGRNSSDSPLILNQTYLYSGDYSITVSALQAAGTYTLATNCNLACFNDGVELYVDGRYSSVGELTLSKSVSYNGRSYSLSSDGNSNLYLTITAFKNSIASGAAPAEEVLSAEGACGGVLLSAFTEEIPVPEFSAAEDISEMYSGNDLLLAGMECCGADPAAAFVEGALASGPETGPEKFALLA